jgi:hypothetical protein
LAPERVSGGRGLQAPDELPNQVVDLVQRGRGIEVLDIVHVSKFDRWATPAKRCSIMGRCSVSFSATGLPI